MEKDGGEMFQKGSGAYDLLLLFTGGLIDGVMGVSGNRWKEIEMLSLLYKEI